MRRRTATRLHRTAALLAPFVVCGVLGQTPRAAHAQAEPAADARPLRVAPGDAVFSVTPAGVWTFGARGGRLLVESGAVTVYASDENGTTVELVNAVAGSRSLLPSGGVSVVQEGAPGGTRYPSSRADDDNDGRVDEDPFDRTDNDRDGKIDEDFAAIGDAMAVVKYGAAAAGVLSVRQEVYAWSLPHIDRMVASTLFIRNIGDRTLAGLRVGVTVVPGDAIHDRLLARSKQGASAGFATASVMLRGSAEALALLLFAPAADESGEWTVRDDGATVAALSPVLDDLAPGEFAILHLALVAASADETRATRAVQAARRTVLGDGSARMIPPPVSVTAHGGEPAMDAPEGVPVVDAFWFKPGKLDELLLGGSPNPFRDAITIDYEIPSSAPDEDGVEHALPDAAIATSVKVYNVTGRLVATLVDAPHVPGRYRTGWTAQADDGGTVASGVYYVKLTIGKRAVTKRLVQIK